MKIVFLDFDGVLNRGSGPALPELVSNLDHVLQRTGAQIVVHSSWRWERTTTELREVLRGWGVEGPVLDKCSSPSTWRTDSGLLMHTSWDEWAKPVTDRFGHKDERAVAIQLWLDDHPEVTGYVIFDDAPAMGHFKGSPSFIQTRMREGLTREQSERAIALLRQSGI